MVTVLRDGSLRVVIFVDDHAPAHVHVFGDSEAKIDPLGEDGQPSLIWNVGMKRGEVRRAMRIVSAARDVLLARWETIHAGTD